LDTFGNAPARVSQSEKVGCRDGDSPNLLRSSSTLLLSTRFSRNGASCSSLAGIPTVERSLTGSRRIHNQVWSQKRKRSVSARLRPGDVVHTPVSAVCAPRAARSSAELQRGGT
jgi:hypothetical protein